MIIEIIIILGFLGSLVGFIFFVKHYFKSWKAKSDNKKMLLAIESAEDEYVYNDKFYKNILDKIDFGKIVIFIFFVGIAILAFGMLTPSGKEDSTGNQGVQEKQVNTFNSNNSTNLNQTNSGDLITTLSEDVKVPLFKNTNIPLWIFLVIGGIIFWIITRRTISFWL